MYHFEKRGKSACGAPARGSELVERALRADCSECRKIAKVEPLPAVEIKVVEPPSVDELLGRLIRLLCEAPMADRRWLVEKALTALGVP